MEIREVSRSGAHAFLDAVGEAEMGGHYNPDDENHRSWVMRCVDRYFARGARMFAAFGNGGEPLGYAAALIDDAPGFSCKAELISIGTAPAHRREGIGSRLLDHITTVCSELGLYCIITSTYAGDTGAIAFYTRNGFVPIAVLPGVHGPRDEGQIFLRKVLGSWDWQPRVRAPEDSGPAV
jgi:ribosomal protein S18 acetylase RimI-like enzyme